MHTLATVPTSQHKAIPAAVPTNLQQAKFIFIYHNTRHIPLQRSYECPFKVIETVPKIFKVDIGGKTDMVMVDKLKLAHLDLDNPVWVAQPQPQRRPLDNPCPKSTTPVQPKWLPQDLTGRNAPEQADNYIGHNVTSWFWGVT